MIDLPAAKERAADIPALALAVRCKDKCALSCTRQNPNSAHHILLSEFPEMLADEHLADL
jgi:hypothetical protein